MVSSSCLLVDVTTINKICYFWTQQNNPPKEIWNVWDLLRDWHLKRKGEEIDCMYVHCHAPTSTTCNYILICYVQLTELYFLKLKGLQFKPTWFFVDLICNIELENSSLLTFLKIRSQENYLNVLNFTICDWLLKAITLFQTPVFVWNSCIFSKF